METLFAHEVVSWKWVLTGCFFGLSIATLPASSLEHGTSTICLKKPTSLY